MQFSSTFVNSEMEDEKNPICLMVVLQINTNAQLLI